MVQRPSNQHQHQQEQRNPSPPTGRKVVNQNVEKKNKSSFGFKSRRLSVHKKDGQGGNKHQDDITNTDRYKMDEKRKSSAQLNLEADSSSDEEKVEEQLLPNSKDAKDKNQFSSIYQVDRKPAKTKEEPKKKTGFNFFSLFRRKEKNSTDTEEEENVKPSNSNVKKNRESITNSDRFDMGASSYSMSNYSMSVASEYNDNESESNDGNSFYRRRTSSASDNYRNHASSQSSSFYNNSQTPPESPTNKRGGSFVNMAKRVIRSNSRAVSKNGSRSQMETANPPEPPEPRFNTSACLLLELDQMNSTGTGNVAAIKTATIYRQALLHNEASIKAMAERLGDDDPAVIKRKIQTADIYKGLGMLQDAYTLLREVVEVQRKRLLQNTASENVTPSPRVALALALNDLALVVAAMYRADEAEQLFEEAFNVLASGSSRITVDVAIVLCNMAVTYRENQEYSKAIKAHERAVKIMEAVHGTTHPEAMFQRAHYGITLQRAGDLNKGKRMLVDAVNGLDELGYRESHIWMKTFLKELNL